MKPSVLRSGSSARPASPRAADRAPGGRTRRQPAGGAGGAPRRKSGGHPQAARTKRVFEEALLEESEKYVLRLYVAGTSARSRQAVLSARRLCEEDLQGRCELEVIDVYQQPILARDGQIIATPTLVKEFPEPVRRLIGNLTNTRRLIVGLDMNRNGRTSGRGRAGS